MISRRFAVNVAALTTLAAERDEEKARSFRRLRRLEKMAELWLATKTQRDTLAAENAKLRAALDEVRKLSGLGCDANGGGEHNPMKQGPKDTFCANCGETLRTSDIRERARAAEAENAKLREALKPFAAVAELMRPLRAFETWPDDKPNSEFIPGAWPRWGDFEAAAALLHRPTAEPTDAQ